MANLQPKRRLIVDSHVHMWKATTAERPWVPGARPQLPEPFTIERIVPMMDEAWEERQITMEKAVPNVPVVPSFDTRFALLRMCGKTDPLMVSLSNHALLSRI
jgi:hypothetical protein